MFLPKIHGYPYLKSIVSIVISVLALDQLTKILARVYLQPVHSVSVLGDFFRLTYVENPGIAFGIRVNNKVFFTILSLIAVAVIFYYLLILREKHFLRFSFAIILGGAVGNLLDRFLYGRVVDFFDFDFFNIQMPSFKFLFFEFHGYYMDRWPVFNIADVAVSIGMILIIFYTIFDSVEEKQKENVLPEKE
ncbi:MAG: signal peptidase II [Calditrichia bacterium]